MSKKLLFIIIFFIYTSLVYSQKLVEKGGLFLYNAPFYVNYGYSQRYNDLDIYFPFIGIGLNYTKYSIAFYAQTGINIYYKDFSWRLEYLQGIVPDLGAFDYKNLEYFGQNIFTYDLNSFRISSLTKTGIFLYSKYSENYTDLEKNSDTKFGLGQVFSLDAQIFNNDFVTFTSMISFALDHIVDNNQTSFNVRIKTPITINFLGSKLGFMATAFYTDYLSEDMGYMIAERFSGYDEAIDIFIHDIDGLYNNFYDMYFTLDAIYRIYMEFLPRGYDRLYFAFGGNTGIAYSKTTENLDHLYMGTVAFGYELYDTIPFEVRFTVDQDLNVFFNISVVSPISHRFDSNLD